MMWSITINTFSIASQDIYHMMLKTIPSARNIMSECTVWNQLTLKAPWTMCHHNSLQPYFILGKVD